MIAARLTARQWLLLASLTLFWGVNWTALKVGLSEIAPWTFRSICLAAGAGVLFAGLRLANQPLSVPRSQWGRLALIAFVSVTCWNILVAFGVQRLPSGRAVVLCYTMPVFAIPLAAWWLRERVTARQLLGLCLGMAGILLLVSREFEGMRGEPVGALCALGAALAWGVGTVLQKKFPIDAPLAAMTAWLMLVGGIPIYFGAFVFELGKGGDFSLAPSLALAYNVFIAFAWGYWAWIKLVQAVSVAVFSISMLMTPVVGVLSGILFLGERPAPTEVAAMALVMAALAVVALAPQAKGGTS
ncbi:MAG: DMT family transporter [Betaproteobacteria bacterium]|nr:DMT family transporter [Betaproteobacteria bacterium]